MALGWVGRSVMTAEGRWGRLDLEEREGRPTAPRSLGFVKRPFHTSAARAGRVTGAVNHSSHGGIICHSSIEWGTDCSAKR